MIKTLLYILVIMLVTAGIGVGISIANGDDGQKGSKRKRVQEINFDGSDVDGATRRPEGAYLVQKRGIDFEPLYNVKRQFDESIRDSVDYLK